MRRKRDRRRNSFKLDKLSKGLGHEPRCEVSRMRIPGASGKRCQYDANGVRRRVCPGNCSRRSTMAKCGFRAFRPDGFSNIKAQATWCQRWGIVISDHQFRRFGFNNSSSCVEEFCQESRHIWCRRMDSAPGRTKRPPVTTIPVPVFRGRIATTRFRCSKFGLDGNHRVNCEPT